MKHNVAQKLNPYFQNKCNQVPGDYLCNEVDFCLEIITVVLAHVVQRYQLKLAYFKELMIRQ